MARKALDQSFDELIKEQFGDIYNISKEESDRLKELKFLSTGSFSFDTLTGRGGIPRGRLTFIYGRHGSFKSHLCLNTVKHTIIDSKLNVIYVDTEGGIDEDFALSFIPGVVTDDSTILDTKIEYTHPDGSVNYTRIMKAESLEQALIICEKSILSKNPNTDRAEFGLLVLDSIAGVSPEEEKNKELTENTMMLLSKALSKFWRRMTYPMQRNEIAVIFIGQVRDKIGAYVPTVVPTGGNALQHTSSLDILLQSQTGKDDLMIQGDNAIGALMKFTVKNSKIAPPFRSYSVPMLFGKGVDEIRDFVNLAEEMGTIERRAKSSWYTYEGNTVAQGFDKLVEWLNQNPDKIEIIKEQTRKIINGCSIKLGESIDE